MARPVGIGWVGDVLAVPAPLPPEVVSAADLLLAGGLAGPVPGPRHARRVIADASAGQVLCKRGGRGGLGMGAGRRLAGALAAVAILAADCTPVARHLLRLPARITVAVGQVQTIRLDVPGALKVRVRAPAGGLMVDGAEAGARWRRVPGGSVRLAPSAPGGYRLGMRLFGILPWRAITVDAVPVAEVVPGGQSVGILLQAQAPLVVQLAPLRVGGRTLASPAGVAGVRVGDVIASVDGTPVETAPALAKAVAAAAGSAVRLGLRRGGRSLSLRVVPARDPAAGRWLLGLYVRDEASGIGTLTYAAPAGTYGALGHAVSDPDTGVAVPLGEGELLPSFVEGMEPSRNGHPGEKVGLLVAGAPPLGTVTANTRVGVFGRLLRSPSPAPLTRPLPVALPDQVRPGPATMYTVLSGWQVGSYAIRITAIFPQRRRSGRGLVVQITDPRLLAESGGIVQGMSGSPIVQDGRLVGALTHVFVDDPTRGYGVLARWMTTTGAAATTAASAA